MQLKLMEPAEIIEVATRTIACDGGKGALGHPRVFLTLDKGGAVDCPYCGRHYVLAAGAPAGDGH